MEVGIPVTTVDGLCGYPEVDGVISGNFPTSGTQYGAYLVQWLAKESDGESVEGDIVSLRKIVGVMVDILRCDYFLEVISYLPDIHILESCLDNDDTEQSLINTQNALQLYDDIDAFFCEGLTQTPVAIEAINSVGHWESRRDGKKIIMLTIDDTEEPFDFVDQGLIRVNRPHTPLIGDIGVRYICKVLEGEALPKDIATPDIPMVTVRGDMVFGFKTVTSKGWCQYASGSDYVAKQVESYCDQKERNPVVIGNKDKLKRTVQNITEKAQGLSISILIFVILLVISVCFIPRVSQLKDLKNPLRTYAFEGIVAVGLSPMILTRETDVSARTIMTPVMAVVVEIYDIGELAVIVAMCCTGVATGFPNGYLATNTKIPSLILTIGTTSMFNGLAAILARAQKKYITDLYHITLTLVKGGISGIPISLLLCVALAFMFEFMLRKPTFGKKMYCTGTNRRVSWMSGVNISQIKIIYFTVSGLLVAITALLIPGQLEGSAAQLGNGCGVAAISIAVPEGISLNGGEGTVIGTLLGFITIGLVQNMLAVTGFGTYVLTTLKGAMITSVAYPYSLAVRKWA